MFICHCRGVTDKSIRAAIVGGARSREEITLRTSAGSRCRGCWPALEELLDDVEQDLALTSLNGSHNAA
jgi:bacterioferritin-associated ferredoxin